MLASQLVDRCLASRIHFFTGVPDSFLKALCDELYIRFGTSSPNHVVAHSEGAAIGLCAGHYLGTGLPSVCYMQNSGLGNAVNPLVSLMDAKVYDIPCLLIIGWRGEPGTKDEPQHIRQGEITLPLLDLLDIPWCILSPDTAGEEFDRDWEDLMQHLKNNRRAALVVRKGALVSDCRPDYHNPYRMTREQAADIILSCANDRDLFVSTTGKLSREVFEIREKKLQPHHHDFLTVGSMGHASMIALGLAEQQPDRFVWCLDGDGAAMMHLGALPLIGSRVPARFVHVVINNGAHETVGGMPVCSGMLNLKALASASGYRHVFSADSESTLRNILRDIVSAGDDGPFFLEVRCACGARKDLGRPTTTPRQNLDAFCEYITKS